MKRPRYVVGRKDECDIRIPVAHVSREHCEVRIDDGRLVIRDLGSSNGTYVNRDRVQERELAPGDLVAVGPAVFVVRIDGEPASIDAKESFKQGAPPEPVAAAAPAAARPSAPTPAKKAAAPAKPASPAKPAAEDEDDDLDFDLNDDSSVIDFDLLLDDDEKDQPKL